MAGYKKLRYEDLVLNFDFIPHFDTTLEIMPYKDLIGQDRANCAIQNGIAIKMKGYNIFAAGDCGTGKKSIVFKKVMEYAAHEDAPEDWCYVYNFKDYSKPLALNLKAGTSEDFKSDMESLVQDLFEDVQRFFNDEEYESERNRIIEHYQGEQQKAFDRLYKEAKENGFNVKNTEGGFAFIPVTDGEEMSEKKYNELPDEDKDNINTKVSSLKLTALDVIRKSRLIKKDLKFELKKLDDRTALSLIEDKLYKIRENYGYNEKIINYLDDFEKDIIENIDAFMEDDENGRCDEFFLKRYSVNIMVCNKDKSTSPVIFEENPEYHNLIGIIEYENSQGSLVTDFTMIKPGSLHKANGGYLIIDGMQLISSGFGWDALIKSLKTGKIFIENLKNQYDIIPISTINPEAIPLNTKVIILGSPIMYNLMYNYDEDFRELFKIKADFDSTIKSSRENVIKILGFISSYCEENSLLHLDRDAVIDVLRYSLRRADSKKYFTLVFSDIADILNRSSVFALNNGNNWIDKDTVNGVVKINEKMHDIYKEKMLDMYSDGKYIINLKGYKIGEINGLSVMEYGDFAFGKQNRITVTSYPGGEGVINIERETRMSGNIHSKGILILSGYLNERFGQDIPLAFNANICFEQMYGEIDGDSASCAELIALMSSLADVPLLQSIAVTGSINQKGEIQPVGGINEKIEGFYDLCSASGFDGSHGVIIPESNADDLVLKDEVIDAVKKRLFSIYTVSTIDECFEILCRSDKNLSASELINDRIFKKLDRYKDFNKKNTHRKNKQQKV